MGGAGGSGNYRGGAGGVMSNVILADNVGGGGGGSSFVSNSLDYEINSEQEAFKVKIFSYEPGTYYSQGSAEASFILKVKE